MRRDGGDPGGDAETNVAKPCQLIHHGVDLPRALPLQIEDGFGVVEDYDHLLRGQVLSQGGQILRVFDVCADDLGQSTEKMGSRSRELVAADEPPVVTKSLLDPIVVEDG
jgi:hypothetical protein